MANNEYGLDTDYLEKRMSRMVRDIKQYTPDEAFNELSRMAVVAAQQAGHSVTIKIKYKTDA
jgi:hypothetical protein